MKTRLLILVTILLTSVGTINAEVFFVDSSATGTNLGWNWANAYTQLQDALDAAVPGDQIYVAKGTYLPTTMIEGATDRHKAFQMKNGVSIYGGFAGTETNHAQRTDYGFGETNETILSGDFNGDDVISGSGSTLAITNNSENCYHIFNHPEGYALTSSAVLDGFTIKGGNASGGANPYNDGAGIYNQEGQSPKINNCYFIGNRASDNGGAYFGANAADATITNCTFALNYATDAGGAMGNYDSDPTITNCLFYGNKAKDEKGGAIYNYSASSPTIINSTITENSSVSGGGVYNEDNSDITIINSIIYGNTINGGVGVQVRNYTNSNLTLSYSDIEGGIDGGIYSSSGGSTIDNGNNINSDPQFVGSTLNVHHPYSIWGTSPCADAGYDDANSQPYDIRGVGFDRKLSKTDGTAGTIDMGAYEFNINNDPVNTGRYYVDADASGNDNGSNWANAFTSFQSALDIAVSGDEIWVAAGTYKPSSFYGGPTTTTRYSHFRMINGVTIYGGFAGTETTVADRTNFGSGGANETILSGDVGTPDDNSDNCYHVFYHPYGLNLDGTAVLDGFSITGGNANLGSQHTWGGGMYNYSSSPSIINCTFINNTALVYGGGICNHVNSSQIENTVFVNNTASLGGGLADYYSSCNIISCTFTNNTASGPNFSGGGLYFRESSSSLTNCLVNNNTANNGGGIYIKDASPSITNSTITESSSSALYCTGATTSPTIINTIIWGNNDEAVLNVSDGNPTFSYCDIEGSGGSSSWDTNLGTNGGNNIDANPKFVGSAVSAEHPYLIYGISPCADAGDNSANSETNDIRGFGFGRKLNKETGATEGTIDIGAYEYKHGTDPYAPPAIYVDFTASGSNDGSSWDDAYTSLQSALDEAVTGQEIWVAKGTYYPSSAYDLTDSPRYYHFRMIDGVAIYGGFAGTESATSERANYGAGEANETVLSGDFNDDDVISGSGSTLSITNNSENSYHVFYHPSGMNLTTTAILDGFTISGGNSDGVWPHQAGGGVFNDGASPTINNCSFTGNTVTDSGGGIYNKGFSTPNISNSTFFENSSKYGGGISNANSSPNVNNCSFSGNYASWNGGGVRNNDFSTTPSFTNCTFSGNYAGNGGGIFTSQSTAIVVTNCLFINNSTQYDGGGMYIASCSPTVANCTFSQNTASRNGGGIIISGAFSPSISNTIVWNNTASSSGNNIYNQLGSTPTFSYCDIEGSGGSSSWVGATFGTNGGSNIDTDPQFVGSGDYPYSILGVSPCSDAGDNSVNSETTDIRGGSFGRTLDKDNGTLGIIDMGAYEYNFSTDPLAGDITWNGSSSSDWNTTANWSGGAVPTASDNVIIPSVATNNPIIAAGTSADCNDLTINSGGVLTIQSTVSGTGSLITTGTVTNNGTFTVERYLTDGMWHFVSPSTTDVTANDFYWNDSPVCWLTSHNETDDTWTYNTDLVTAMPLGKGWSVWVDNTTKSPATVTMTGDMRTTDLPVNLARSGNGWNLIGNPFTSAIDCDAISWTSPTRQSFTTGTQYVWDNDYNGGDYRTWNGSSGDLIEGIIPISQAFFVQAIYSGNLNIPTTARVHNSTGLYKSSERNGESPYVRLQLDFENHGNTVFIGFPENGTDYFDNKGDATKLYANDEFPQMYALEDGIKLSTNALAPLSGGSKTVSLHVDQVVDGEYTMTLSQLENLPNMAISLEDLQTGTIHNLVNNPVYTFRASSGDDTGRFLLHFSSSPSGISEDWFNDKNGFIDIYTANHNIYIRSKEKAVNEAGTIEVYTLAGQKLLDQKIEAGTLATIPMDANNSYLVVRVKKPTGTVVNKVFLK